MQSSFGTMEMAQRIKAGSTLMKVHALINWGELRGQLTGLYKRESSHTGGQEPIDPLLMFKAILLGQWHNLSDPKLEEALQVRIDFMHFCGLGLHQNAPDETTLCRFRNRLIRAGKLAPLLGAVNEQLQQHHLMVKHAKGAIIDATLITAAARPEREITIEAGCTKEAKEEDAEVGCIEQTQSADSDATWVKKGKRCYFGYRSHIIVDACDGYIRGVHSTPANQSETTQFEAILATSDFTPQRVYADKGYASVANRAHLKQKKIKSAIMHKAQRNKPLTQRQCNANKRIVKTRTLIEHCFGTAKRLFDMQRTRYFGTVKVNAQFILKAICINLLKAANKIQLSPLSLQERCA